MYTTHQQLGENHTDVSTKRPNVYRYVQLLEYQSGVREELHAGLG